jgi:hypothetical protein
VKKYDLAFELALGGEELSLFAKFLPHIECFQLALCKVSVTAQSLKIVGSLEGGGLPATLRDVCVTLSCAGLRDRFKFELHEFGEVVCRYGAL